MRRRIRETYLGRRGFFLPEPLPDDDPWVRAIICYLAGAAAVLAFVKGVFILAGELVR